MLSGMPSILARFLSGPETLMISAVWVFLLVPPLVWLDSHLKVRQVMRLEEMRSPKLPRRGARRR